jgi:4-amino-4-deoxy-L-arabinose transferase-like glycosyltransferase
MAPSATNNTTISARTLFYATLILHILVWSISPVLIRHTVSADAIESFVWGQYLAWGYDKNPYLAGWIPHFALLLNIDNNAIGYYFVQQLMIGLGFWSIWKLGNLLFSPYRALIAVLIYEACLYFSVYAQTNNDNFPLVGLWGLAGYTFYLACKKQYLKYWLITGFTLGLAMMVKYSTVIFMFGLFLYLLTEKEARRSFYQSGLYLGAIAFLLPVLPNFIWLYQHDFVALTYISSRTALAENNLAYLGYIGEFIQQTAFNFIGCLALFALTNPRLTHASDREKTTTRYLWCVGMFPLMAVLVSATALGWQLYWEWGVPFIVFWGLLLVNYLKPQTNPAAILRFMIGVLFAICISLAGNILISCYWQAGKGSADYPAKPMANYVMQLWHARYDRPLPIVVGSRYTAGYIGFYAGDKPIVFVDEEASPNTDTQANIMKKNGAIFVQDNYYGTRNTEQFPRALLEKYPQLIVLPAIQFPYHRSEKSGEVVKLLIGILPPH